MNWRTANRRARRRHQIAAQVRAWEHRIARLDRDHRRIIALCQADLARVLDAAGPVRADPDGHALLTRVLLETMTGVWLKPESVLMRIQVVINIPGRAPMICAGVSDSEIRIDFY